MAVAIGNTSTSVVGSSITTVAGFIALCFMSFTLGLDLGVVMAKGVIFGVIGCVTILPSLVLTFDRALEKTMHREIMPNFSKFSHWIVNHSWIFLLAFIILLVPAIYGYNNTKVYYDLSSTLPEELDCSQANTKLAESFKDLNSIYMVLVDSDLSEEDGQSMLDEIKNVDGISFALGLPTVTETGIPEEFLPESVVSELKGGDYQLMLISSEYTIASDEINNQINEVKDITKKYDSSSMVIGEAPCTKDLITITDKDFKTVSFVSIAAIFVIILFVLKSISLPILLVAAI
jgi:predicted RND superfamily exporter protein